MSEFPGIPDEILGRVTTGAKKQIDMISRNYQIVATNMEEVRQNQNQQMLALATMYVALEEIAKKLEVKLPKPLINMKIEGG